MIYKGQFEDVGRLVRLTPVCDIWESNMLLRFTFHVRLCIFFKTDGDPLASFLCVLATKEKSIVLACTMYCCLLLQICGPVSHMAAVVSGVVF